MFSVRVVGSLTVWLCAFMLACAVKADPNPPWIVTRAGGPPDVR
jgi:hypothetical protein